MRLPIKSIFAGAQGLEEYDLHDADGVMLGTIYVWSDVVRIVHAVNNTLEPQSLLSTVATTKNAAPQTPDTVRSGAQGEGAVSRQGEPLSPSTVIATPAVAAPDAKNGAFPCICPETRIDPNCPSCAPSSIAPLHERLRPIVEELRALDYTYTATLLSGIANTLRSTSTTGSYK